MSDLPADIPIQRELSRFLSNSCVAQIAVAFDLFLTSRTKEVESGDLEYVLRVSKRYPMFRDIKEAVTRSRGPEGIRKLLRRVALGEGDHIECVAGHGSRSICVQWC